MARSEGVPEGAVPLICRCAHQPPRQGSRVEYLAGKIYLQPHPRELTLRNHV